MKDITTEEAISICKDFIKENKERPIILHTAIEKVLNELEIYKHYYEELTTGQVTSAHLLEKYVNREAFDTAVEHQTELIRENSHFRYELFNNQKELEKKDKIIDAMAEVIEECRQNDCIESEEIDLSEITGTEAIKQYFERSIENG